MPFSAATCLTFNPTLQSAVGPFEIYLNSDYSSTPFVSNVDISELTPPNCPFIIQNIPTGTSNLGFKDITKEYCITIPIQNNDICTNCNLGFSNYSSTTISKLYCGNLTGSCQTITDYKIDWYGPNDTTTLAFTSGSGNIFSYTHEHPFSTQLESIPCESGVYTPVIQNIILNGVRYSNTGGTGNILFSGSCLPTTNILPLTCDIKTNTNPDYRFSAFTNYLEFSSLSSNILPVTTTYKISGNTKYIVWTFEGNRWSDRIQIDFSGSSYLNKIGIEDFIIGDVDLPSSNLSASTYPKSAKTTNFFTKFSCLTGLTVNNNDNIIIKITPLSIDTNWKLYMSCLDDYNCNDCLRTQNYKIVGSTITRQTSSCNKVSVTFQISGCNLNDQSSDFLLYNQNPSIYGSNSSVVSNTGLIQRNFSDLYHSNFSCGAPGYALPSSSSLCMFDNTTTKYYKSYLTDGTHRGVFGFTGSSTFISTYYNSIRNSFLGLSPYSSLFSGSSDPYTITYYRAFKMKIPSTSVGNENCGDNNTFVSIYLHHTSPYVSGTTGSGDYFLSVTANTISNLLSYTNCDLYCNSSIDSNVINLVNNSSTGLTPSYGTRRDFNSPYGMYYTNPITDVFTVTTGNTTNTTGFALGLFRTSDWTFNTYPFSGNPSTIIPSLSGVTCNYFTTGVKENQFNSFLISQYKYYYKIELTNPLNLNDFDIWASPINNFSYSGAPSTTFYDLAYRYSGGNVTYSSSTYIIG